MPYFHDPSIPQVAHVPDKLEVYERDQHWNIRVEVEITRADNWLTDEHRWAKPTTAIPRDSYYKPNYSLEDAKGYFHTNNLSGFGSEISEKEYRELKAEYERRARSNKAPG